MRTLLCSMLLVGVLLLMAAPAYAAEQLTYISQPEEVTVFLNNVVFVRDSVVLAGDSEAQIVLPAEMYQETLVVRDGGERVSGYSISRATGQAVLRLNPSGGDLREISLDYLAYGMSWRPLYDLQIVEGEESLPFVFLAEIQNTSFTLENVDVTLAAGRVDVGQQFDQYAAPSVNQYIAGYEESATAPTLAAGAVTIQHTYPIGALDAIPGDNVYIKLLEKSLPARRVLLWNAQTDQQVTVIYKVRNDSTIPLTDGIVHSYQNDLFIGSDPVEFTPVGSEGSITVGRLQDIRVNRAETTSYIQSAPGDSDTLHEITLTMSNFDDDPVEIEVVDYWPTRAVQFAYSQEPERDAGNLFRWIVTIPAGETVTVTYSFRAPD